MIRKIENNTVNFYLNNDVSINLFIIIALGLGLAGIAFLLNKSEK